MTRVVGKRVLGVNNERNSLKCHVCGRLSHIEANYCMIRPCPKCDRYGHSPNNCWGINPLTRGNKMGVP